MITPTRIEQVAIYLEDTSKGDEAFYRSAASRYYYAIYHMLMYELDKQGKPLMKADQGGMHEDLLFSAEQAGGTLRRAAYAAREAKQIRVVADYRLEADFGADLCRKAAQIAKRIDDLVTA